VGEAEDHGEKVVGRIGFGDSSGGLGPLDRGDLLPLGLEDRLGQRPAAGFELVPGGEPDDLGTGGVVVDEGAGVGGLNLSGLFYSMKYEIPPMLAAGGGAIVNVSSVFAERGGPSADYSSAKHAVRGLTRTTARDYAARGIRVNELQPGVIDTEMTQANPEGTQAVADNGIPLRRVGTAPEVATAIAFLLSDDASYITGAHLAADGGFLA
jgi:NAD(P)-dependent dehydrogenase (short-subunit alcohol dehydrogenase family)